MRRPSVTSKMFSREDALRWAVETCLRASGDCAYLEILRREIDHPQVTADVRDFREKLGERYDGPPRHLPDRVRLDRTDHLVEEMTEYIWAKTLEKKLDALVDVVYVALDMAYQHGFDFDEAWRRVHAANMLKHRLPGEVRITKPEGWVAPDLSDLARGDR